MKSSFVKRLSITLVVVLIALTIALGAVGLTAKREPKRGIVIVTAFLSGGLYLNNPDGTQTQLWDPVADYEDFPTQEILDPVNGLTLTEDTLKELLNGFGGILPLLNMLTDKENGLFPSLAVDMLTGESIKDISPANPDSPNRLKYGAINAYKETYDEMLKEYGDIAEVVVFNYDWRLDNEGNAKLLEEFINERGFDEVVLTSHSMGGNVVSLFLQKPENREKVVLYTPYSPATLGAVDALVFLEDPGRLVDGIDLGSLGSVVNVKSIVNDVAKPFLRNLVSMYQLLPSPYLMTSGQYSNTDGDFMITIDGEPIATTEELIEFYKSRPYSKIDGEWIYPYQVEENGKTRLENYWENSRVDVDGVSTHTTNLVNTVYFVGVGQNGAEGANFITNEDGEIVLDSVRYTTDGDNMVLEYSATCGNDPNGENVEQISNGHLNVGINFKVLLMERTFEEIDKVWRNN